MNNNKLTTEERSKVRRFLLWMYRNEKYDIKGSSKTTKEKLLQSLDSIEENSILNKEDAFNIRLFLEGGTISLRNDGKKFIYDDVIFMSAFDKIHNMSILCL